MPRTTIVSNVPDPFTPPVFGWRVKEIKLAPPTATSAAPQGPGRIARDDFMQSELGVIGGRDLITSL